MRGLKGKTVIVTGAASGIGDAIARRLGEEGMTVGIFDINAVGAEATAKAIRDAGGKAQAHAVDITSYDAVKAGVAAFEAAAGSTDCLVNNAGWDKAEPFLQTEPEIWRKVIDINLYGPIHMCHAVLTGMAERGRGRVVSIASDAGRVGSSGEAVYSACKGGIIAMTKTMARELSRTGITLNTVCPGPTDTPLLAEVNEKLRAALERAIPMKRLAKPADYPGMVAFLLSDDAGYITGQTISVSGGLTMHG
jgi:2-hydroxycyclohexanecarboxyl-CoA dehydrogenase